MNEEAELFTGHGSHRDEYYPPIPEGSKVFAFGKQVYPKITEVAQMELQDNLRNFFARVPEMAEVQKYSERMTPAQAEVIWESFTYFIG